MALRLSKTRWVEAGILALVGAAAGLASLWLTVGLGPDWVLARGRGQGKVLAGLVAGIAAALYWLSIQDVPLENAASLQALLIWIALIIGPFAISVKYLLVLGFAQVESFRRVPSAPQ